MLILVLTTQILLTSLTHLLHESCAAPYSHDCSTSLNNLNYVSFNSITLLTFRDRSEEQKGNILIDSNDKVSDTPADPPSVTRESMDSVHTDIIPIDTLANNTILVPTPIEDDRRVSYFLILSITLKVK